MLKTQKTEPPKRKRKTKRKRVELPEPSRPELKVGKRITSIKCTLNQVLCDPNTKPDLENLVVTVNQHRKRLAMLAKEFLLRKLHNNEKLPQLNQNFFSALSTAMRNGKWSKRMADWGEHDLLKRHQAPTNGVNRTLLHQAMCYVSTQMEAQVKTHYTMHYERFLKRWSKLPENQRGELDEKELHVDPEGVELNEVVEKSWKIRRCLENATKKGFALFPEARLEMGYVTLDTVCVTQLFKQMFPESKLLLDTKGRKLNIGDLAKEHGKEIWSKLFHTEHIQKLRGENHDFHWSMKTDGYGVVLHFYKTFEYLPKRASKRRKVAKQIALQDLKVGFDYTHTNKTLGALEDLNGYTVRAVDPGVHRTYTSVDLLTEEKDVRNTAMVMPGKSWYARTKSKTFGGKQKKWRDDALAEQQKALNKVPYCTSSFPDRYKKYVDATYEHWEAFWAFVRQWKRRKLRFRADCVRMRELDREVNRLCKPRDGDHTTLLIFGNGARMNLFGKVRSSVRGPSKRLVKHTQERKKAVTVWADEYRTSKLDIYGHELKHPPERRKRHALPPKCRANCHASDALGCRCYCREKNCEQKRTFKYWCNKHKKTVYQHDVCYCDNKEHGHRMWNRDVSAAINIGCLFLKRGQKEVIPKSWAEVFCNTFTPFSLPMARCP